MSAFEHVYYVIIECIASWRNQSGAHGTYEAIISYTVHELQIMQRFKLVLYIVIYSMRCCVKKQ